MTTLFKRKDSNYWWIQYTINGKRIKESTEIPLEAKQLAKRYLDKVKGDIAVGKTGLGDSAPDIEYALKKWADTVRSTKSAGTTERYFQVINNFTAYYTEMFPTKLRLSDITSEQIQDWINHRCEIRSPGTVRFEATTLNIWLNWCTNKMEYIRKNPAKNIEKPKAKTRKPFFWSPERLTKILSESEKIGRRDFYEFLYRSLARAIKEAATFTRIQVDFKRNVLIFLADATKGGRTEEIEIPAKLLPILERRCQGLKDNDLIFPEEYSRRHNKLLTELKKILKKLKLTGNLHAFRHTGISHLVMPPDPVPLRIVQHLARHKDIATTLKYSHLSKANKMAGYINNTPV